VRAGVFVFFDLMMAGIGVCGVDDIALSVLTTVIGHKNGRTLIDAGWMALSQDLSTGDQAEDRRYGVVCDASGRPIPNCAVISASQEHGQIAHVGDGGPRWPVGTQLRILPVHACATAAQHDQYHVLDRGKLVDVWPRFRGW
jgi:D-serine deaminase-like pyridoxal phosphate-dependent protein